MGQRRPVRAKRSPRQLRAGPTDDPVLANRRRLAELARAPQVKLATPPLPDGPTVAYAGKLVTIAREAYRIADRTVGAALRDLQRLAEERQDADSDEAKRKRAAAQNRPHTEAEKRQLSLPLELKDAIDRMQRAEEAYADRLPTTDLAMTAAIATERWSAGVQMRVFQSLGLNPIPLGSKLETARDEWVKANSELIVSQPREVSERVGQLVREMVPAGSRWETISARLQEEQGIAERRANLIARDQVAKYNADLTRMQQQAVGFSHYEWRGAMDARERPTHVALEGTIWSWERPPLIGNPGEPIQCRCVAIPVTSAEVMARSKEMGEEELIERTAALGPTQRQGPDATPEEVRKRAAREVAAEVKLAQRRTLTELPTVTKKTALEQYSQSVKMPDNPNARALEHLNDFKKIPDGILTEYFNKGGRIEIVNGSVTDSDLMSAYRGVIPRGWPPGYTWDIVAGTYSTSTTIVGSGSGESLGSVAVHEFAHGIDNKFGKLSSSPDWVDHVDSKVRINNELFKLLQSVTKDYDETKLTWGYVSQPGEAGREELFAESFAMWVHKPDLVRQHAPTIADYFDKLSDKYK